MSNSIAWLFRWNNLIFTVLLGKKHISSAPLSQKNDEEFRVFTFNCLEEWPSFLTSLWALTQTPRDREEQVDILYRPPFLSSYTSLRISLHTQPPVLMYNEPVWPQENKIVEICKLRSKFDEVQSGVEKSLLRAFRVL